MASSGSNDRNSQLNDLIDKSNYKIRSSEHEETLKADQMATKKFDEEVSEIANGLGGEILEDSGQVWCHTIATRLPMLAEGNDTTAANNAAWNCTFFQTELVFSPYFLQLFLLILRVGKKPHSLSPSLSLSRSPHDYVIFHWVIYADSGREIDWIGDPVGS